MRAVLRESKPRGGTPLCVYLFLNFFSDVGSAAPSNLDRLQYVVDTGADCGSEVERLDADVGDAFRTSNQSRDTEKETVSEICHRIYHSV